MSPGRTIAAVDAFAALVVMPFLAMATIALRLGERGEAWLDRAWWLVAIAGLGGLCGGLAVLAGRHGLPRFRRSFWRLMAVGMLFVCGLMLGMMAGYIVYTLIFSGQFEAAPERFFRAIIFASLQTGFLFLISIPPYLLPWPLPFLAGMATVLLARPILQKTSHPPPGVVSKPVEPARPEV